MIDRDYFFKEIKVHLIHQMSQTQVDGLNSLLDTWDKYYSDKPLQYLAYCLATAYHETWFTFKPIKEVGEGHHMKYGAAVGPYHQSYYGRGDVQLTWMANYKNAEQKLNSLYKINVDLVKNPDNALDPQIASLILFQGEIDGWFTGKKLSNYFSGNKEDPTNARRIINGTDKAHVIAVYYTAIKNSLKQKVIE